MTDKQLVLIRLLACLRLVFARKFDEEYGHHAMYLFPRSTP